MDVFSEGYSKCADGNFYEHGFGLDMRDFLHIIKYQHMAVLYKCTYICMEILKVRNDGMCRTVFK